MSASSKGASPYHGQWPALLAMPDKGRFVAVLTCYLDDSGNDDDPVITMAGYISTNESWRRFEKDARSLFDYADLPYLHTVDLHQLRNEFDGWTREQAAEFANAFYTILRFRVGFRIEFSVLKSMYKQRAIEHCVQHKGSPLAFCFQGVANWLINHKAILEAVSQENVDLSFVVESGHKNNQDVLARFNDIQRQAPDLFKSLVFENKKDRIALQTADFLAYFSRRLRCKDKSHKRYHDEFRFFRLATEGVYHHRFFAVDFGN